MSRIGDKTEGKKDGVIFGNEMSERKSYRGGEHCVAINEGLDEIVTFQSYDDGRKEENIAEGKKDEVRHLVCHGYSVAVVCTGKTSVS